MSSLARKIAKKLRIDSGGLADGPGRGKNDTPKASVILKLNAKTGKMQEYHLTKGWRK